MRYDDQDALSLRMARMLDHASLTEAQQQGLADARGRALQLVGREGLLGRVGRLLVESLRPALGVALSLVLVLAVTFTGDRLGEQRWGERARQVDSALLVDDLPIDAYLDDGFRAWIAAGLNS